jgi:hypothetical protein
MIRPDQIPDEVVEAAARAIYFVFTQINIGDGEDRWDCLPSRFRAEYREEARAALAAALAAWPDMVERFFPNDPTRAPGIFLPLPKEGADE